MCAILNLANQPLGLWPPPTRSIFTSAVAVTPAFTADADFARAARQTNAASQGLSRLSAHSLSSNEDRILSQGTNQTFASMISLRHYDPRLTYWGLQGWACQLRTSDLLMLFKSWNSLSLDHFFNFYSSRSPEAALQAALTLSTNEGETIERDLIGSNLFYFRDALSTYCFVLDYIFEMQPEIATALRNARDRIIEFATHRHRGQSDATQLLLQFLFENFSFSLQLIYLQIFGRAIPPAEIIQQMNAIPRSTDNNSDFSVQANIILHQAGTSPVRGVNETPEAKEICKFFAKGNLCRRGDKCRFRHSK